MLPAPFRPISLLLLGRTDSCFSLLLLAFPPAARCSVLPLLPSQFIAPLSLAPAPVCVSCSCSSTAWHPPRTLCIPDFQGNPCPLLQRTELRRAHASGLRVGGLGMGGNPLSLPRSWYMSLRPGMKWYT